MIRQNLLAIRGDRLLDDIIFKLQSGRDIEITIAENLGEAFRILSDGSSRFVLVDFDFHAGEILPFLRKLNKVSPLTDTIVLSRQEIIDGVTTDTLIDTNLPLNEILKAIDDAISLRALLDAAGLIGHSRSLKETARRIRQVAPTDISVLISGPSGTGKELIARAIHANSPRHDQEYISLNCASIPDNLLESELFGYEKGSFTGADMRRHGLLQQAHKGTLLLDEIGEMHPRLQAKLLRAIDTKSFLSVGGRKAVTVDVRVIAATNRDLQREVEIGNFRADLYYRLGVISIPTQRLAERPEDILPIVAAYLGRLKKKISFSPEAAELLLKYGWPGNVRELSNFLQRLLVTDPKSEIDRKAVEALLDRHSLDDRTLPVVTNISAEDAGYRLIYQALLNLANEVMEMKKVISEKMPRSEINRDEVAPLANTGGDMEAMEEQLIRETLRRVNGNRKKAASYLGIGERTLYRKLQKYHLM